MNIRSQIDRALLVALLVGALPIALAAAWWDRRRERERVRWVIQVREP